MFVFHAAGGTLRKLVTGSLSSSDHRAAGEGDAERSEAAGPGDGRRGLPHPAAQRPRRQVPTVQCHLSDLLSGPPGLRVHKLFAEPPRAHVKNLKRRIGKLTKCL